MRYKFTGKERDEETGLDYFGARYYDSDISVWLSVDPLANAYSSTAPYMYVRGNPIMLVDPNGMYDDKAKVQKAQEKAVKKYGDANVGNVYQTKGGDYSFRISKDGFKQHKGDDIVDGADASASVSTEINGRFDYAKHNYKNWKSNLKIAKKMTKEWDQGKGPVNRTFNNDAVANAMRDAWRVTEARDFFYNKYKDESDLTGASVTGYRGDFGFEGLFKAGLDPVEQFVGGYRVSIKVIPGSMLQFTITNKTSVKSVLYGLGPEWERTEFSLNGNTYQTYIFTEPIRK